MDWADRGGRTTHLDVVCQGSRAAQQSKCQRGYYRQGNGATLRNIHRVLTLYFIPSVEDDNFFYEDEEEIDHGNQNQICEVGAESGQVDGPGVEALGSAHLIKPFGKK